MVGFRCLAFALAFSTLALPAKPSSLLPPPDNFTIVAFGSSSTEGIGASNRTASYPAQLAKLLRKSMPKGRTVAVLNRGIGGDDARDMVKRMQRDVIAPHPQLVIWQTGSNDPMKHNPLKNFERETREGIAVMQAAGIEVILMEPQWAPALDRLTTARAYRDTVRKVGADMRIVVIRRSDLMHEWIEKRLMTRTEMLSSDGLHMRDKGYTALARSVAEAVMRTRAFGQMPASKFALDGARMKSRT